MIIDGHVHLIESLRSVCAHGETRPLGNGSVMFADGGTMKIIPDNMGDRAFLAETYINNYMVPAGVDQCILMQAGLYGFQNLYYKEVESKYPGKFFPACTLDPYAENWEDILDNLINKLGYHILKFEVSEYFGLIGYHPDMKLDGPEMRRILDYVADKKVAVTFDVGDRTQTSQQIGALKTLAHDYPNIHFIIEHCLNLCSAMDAKWQDDIKTLVNDNVWFGIASLAWFLKEYEYPFPNSLELVRYVYNTAGSEKMIWGSDVPMIMTKIDYKDSLTYLQHAKFLSEADLDNIYSKAAQAGYYL